MSTYRQRVIDIDHGSFADPLRALTVTFIPPNIDPLPCRSDPELWFPSSLTRTAEDRSRVNRAKDECAFCPIRLACLEWALDNDETGIWGGTTDDDRSAIKEGMTA